MSKTFKKRPIIPCSRNLVLLFNARRFLSLAFLVENPITKLKYIS